MRAFAIRETYPQITCSTVPFCVSSCWLFVKTLCLCLTTLSAVPLNFLSDTKNDVTYWHLVKSVFGGGVILFFFGQVTCISLKRNTSKIRFFCRIFQLTLSPSALTVVLSGGLCVYSYPLICQGHPEDFCTHSHAIWTQIDLLSCFLDECYQQWVNCVSSVVNTRVHSLVLREQKKK